MKGLTILLLLTFCSHLQESNERCISPMRKQEAKLKLDIPKWEPSFFEEIQQRSHKAGLSILKSTALPKGDLEVRLWIGFGTDPLRGFVISRTNGLWAATYLMPIDPKYPQHNYQQNLPTPKDGWETFWNRLANKGILTLPDSSKLGDQIVFPDAQYSVVEVNTGEVYRAYKYAAPEYQRQAEAKRMAAIIRLIFTEFGIEKD